MGVSTLDTFRFSPILASGNPPAPNFQYIVPLNGMLTVSVPAMLADGVTANNLGGGTVTLEVTQDNGKTWGVHAGISIAAINTAQTVQVAATGCRPKLTGATSPNCLVQVGSPNV